MAFRIKRGMVLRTTIPVQCGRTKLKAGTRVKAMAKVDANHLKVKIKDPGYPKLDGEHTTVQFDRVERVARGRPSVDAEA